MLILSSYAGPGSQTVNRKWAVTWDSFLASNRNFIAASIDVRGTGFQGDGFKHSVYEELGKLEAGDTLHVIRQLVERFKFIDREKVCVWGWSYGGYVTGRLMAEVGLEQSGEISCGISVSPVTQWHHYDTAYTERFMGLPSQQHNWRGYILSSLVQVAHNIPDGRFMLIHGTQDDNVHIQHSMQLSRELVENDIVFRQQVKISLNPDLIRGNSLYCSVRSIPMNHTGYSV